MLSAKFSCATLNVCNQRSLLLRCYVNHGHAQISRAYKQGVITLHRGNFIKVLNSFHTFDLEDFPYFILRNFQVLAFVINAIFDGTQRANPSFAAVCGIGACFHSSTGNFGCIDKGEDHTIRTHIQKVLDLMLIQPRHTYKGARACRLRSQNMMIDLTAVHHTMLRIDPNKIETSIPGNFTDRCVCKQNENTNNRLAIFDFFGYFCRIVCSLQFP